MAQERIPTGNINEDVLNIVFKEAEERVYQWLKQRQEVSGEVEDCRKQRGYYDFRIGGLWTLDVKVDQYAATTGMLAVEEAIAHQDGRLVPGWGQHIGLDYVAYVMPMKAKKWRMILVRRPTLMETAVDEMHRQEAGKDTSRMRYWTKQGTDRVAYGVAISIDVLREAGAILKEEEV